MDTQVRKAAFGNNYEYADLDACIAALTADGVDDPEATCAALQESTEAG